MVEPSKIHFLNLEPDQYGLTQEHCSDIKLLDHLLGLVLYEHEGESFLKLAKEIYKIQSHDEAVKKLAQIEELKDPAFCKRLLRAYTVLFRLLNLTEQKEIIRINLLRQSQSHLSHRSESLLDIVQRLHDSGVNAQQMQSMLDRMDVCPTLTAHPTESRRRAVLDKLENIGNWLVELGHPDGLIHMEQPINRKDHIKDDLLRSINALWLTDEFTHGSITVDQEVHNAIYFMEHTIFHLVPCLHRDLRNALKKVYSGKEFRIPPFFQYRSWVGGDRDGNPYVTPEVTWKTLAYHKKIILQLYIKQINKLLRELTQSARLVPADEDLMNSLREDFDQIKQPHIKPERIENEPYSSKLMFMRARLQATLKHMKNYRDYPLTGPYPEPPKQAYKDSRMFLNDLKRLHESLQNNHAFTLADEGLLADLIIQVESFGFHMATLDIRQHSSEHEKTLDDIFSQARMISDGRVYHELSEEEKIELLTKEFYDPRPLISREMSHSDNLKKVLDVFEVMRHSRHVFSTRSVLSYIISMTHSVSDVLEVMILAKEAGLIRWEKKGDTYHYVSDINIVPLFETIDDLEHSSQFMETLFNNEAYAIQLRARNNFQEIMLGYSDSSKDGGYMAANWHLQNTQDKLGTLCEKYNIDLRLFHGRGGTIGRGGGRAYLAIRSQPPHSIRGRIRYTEQGEVISFRYSFFPIAHRHLEQIAGAVLLASSEQEYPEEILPEWKEAMSALANHSRQTYRSLIYENPDFWTFYTQATPIQYIRHLSIASRPVSRGGGDSMKMKDLRAIPWVFSWVQSRYLVPGWYGMGRALEWFANQDENNLKLLQDMYKNWPFFNLIMNNGQVELMRAHIPTSSTYANRVEPQSIGQKIHTEIEEEFQRTQEWISKITQQKESFKRRNVVQRTVKFRNPIVSPMNQIQVMLLDRCQQESNDQNKWTEAMVLSIAGIAAAMQSTG